LTWAVTFDSFVASNIQTTTKNTKTKKNTVMKKMMMMLAMVLTFSTMYAFTGEEAINKQAVNNFKSQFKAATETRWTTGRNYYKAEFTLNEQKLFAYYNMEGEFVAVCRYISSLNLPMNLQTSLKNSYNNYWISDLFEMADQNGTTYYATVENADGKVVLSSTDGITWNVFQRNKKA